MFRKITAAALAFVMTALLCACNVKTNNIQPSSTVPGSSAETVSYTDPVTEITAPSFANTAEYWSFAYPGLDINRFSVKFISDGETEKTVDYYFCNAGLLCDWVNTEFNVDGWFYKDSDEIVSADGYYVIKTNDAITADCSYKAEKRYSPVENPHKTGLVHTLNSGSEFRLYGIMLRGLFSDPDANAVYSLHDVENEFEPGEAVDIYIDGLYNENAQGKLAIVCIPHSDDTDFASLNSAIMEDPSCIFSTNDVDPEATPACVGLTLPDESEGLYDILFIVGNSVDYYVTIEAGANNYN